MNKDELRAGISRELERLAPDAPAAERAAATERIMGLALGQAEDAAVEARLAVMKNFGAV